MTTFRPDFTFESFIRIGSCAGAYRLALAFADVRPGAPRVLVLHGQPGVGKTHLLHAIGQVSLRSTPPGRVHAATAADLAGEAIMAIRQDQTDAFRRKHAASDLLLIDDLLELRDKPATQTVLAAYMRAWVGAGARIAAASGVPRTALPHLAKAFRPTTARWVGLRRATPWECNRLMVAFLARRAVTMQPAMLERVTRTCGGDVRRLVGAATQVAAAADQPVATSRPPWIRSRGR